MSEEVSRIISENRNYGTKETKMGDGRFNRFYTFISNTSFNIV